MALDKQKILNELGNVVTQLQSADCGCMGKLFSNSNQPNQNGSCHNTPMANPTQDGYMEGCYHRHGCRHGCHGYNAPGAGEPFSSNHNCMGYYNPAKLYSDTYNCVNHNLVQPVVKEMYDDLKSISPANTMMNNPMTAQMGPLHGNNSNPTATGTTGGQMRNQIPGGAMGKQNGLSNDPLGQQQMEHKAQPMTAMQGMGSDIVNMMGDTRAKTGNPTQSGIQGGVIGNNALQYSQMSPTSNMSSDIAHGQYKSGIPDNNIGQFNNTGMINMEHGNPRAPMQNPTTQYMTQPSMHAGANMNMQGMNDNMCEQMRSMSANPIQPHIKAINSCDQHRLGMAKFNEMYGLMQKGDLEYDPMAIAIQMNPANQQTATEDTVQKIMMNNSEGHPNASFVKPAAANIVQSYRSPTYRKLGQQNMVPTSIQQQIPGANPEVVSVQNNQINRQQVPQQQQYLGQYQQQNQLVDPNTGAVATGILPTVFEGLGDPNASQKGLPPSQSLLPTTQKIKEPIFPADTLRSLPPNHMNLKHQKYYHYNTLGQPVDVMPADIYRSPEPSLPQTLSPQPVHTSDPGRYSNVKAIVSKTSLMGSMPDGRTPGRGQLQQIYNQYKGPQLSTQQNIRSPDYGGSYSERNLNVPQGNTIRQVPIERISGDTATNNAINNHAYKAELKPGLAIEDVPAANKLLAAEKPPVKQCKVRNGLQDIAYTSYVTSAWTFHGAARLPFSST